GDKFVVTKVGDVAATGSLTLGSGNTAYLSSTTTTFGSSGSPLTTLSVWATDVNVSNNLTVDQVLTASSLAVANDITIAGEAFVQTDLTVQGNLTVSGTNIVLGDGALGSTLSAPLDNFI